MNAKGREELIGIAALLVGLFLGLTLLQLPLTGSWGRGIGGLLWELFGLGSVVVPLLGIGWALAAFERLGALSWRRTAALGAGLVLLVPYGIGVALGPAFPVAYGQWTATQRLVGLFPAFVASGIQGALGTAGAVLAGLLGVSALGIATVGWHPLTLLRGSGLGARTSGLGVRGSGLGGPEARKRKAPWRCRALQLAARNPRVPNRAPNPEPRPPPASLSPPSSC